MNDLLDVAMWIATGFLVSWILLIVLNCNMQRESELREREAKQRMERATPSNEPGTRPTSLGR